MGEPLRKFDEVAIRVARHLLGEFGVSMHFHKILSVDGWTVRMWRGDAQFQYVITEIECEAARLGAADLASVYAGHIREAFQQGAGNG